MNIQTAIKRNTRCRESIECGYNFNEYMATVYRFSFSFNLKSKYTQEITELVKEGKASSNNAYVVEAIEKMEKEK